MISLNRVRKDIEGFFNSHPQVQHYSYGTIDDYIAMTEKEYYAVNVEFINANVSGKYLVYQFNITIADLMDVSCPETEYNAVSSCILIGQDFLAWLTKMEYTFSGGNFQPFREDTPDITAGVVLGFSIQVPLGLNGCAIPEPYTDTVMMDATGDVVTDSDRDILMAE